MARESHRLTKLEVGQGTESAAGLYLKTGFGIPLGQCLRTSLKEQLTDTLPSDRAMQRGYFKPEVVREMVRSHMAGARRYQNALWDLLQLELWHRAFIDQVPIPRQPVLTPTPI